MFGPGDRFELRPTTVEFLLSIDFPAFRRLFELPIDLGALGVFHLELCETPFIVDQDRRAVGHCALNVVHADLVTENAARVCIRLPDWCSGETHELRVRQSIAHMARKTCRLRPARVVHASLVRREHSTSVRITHWQLEFLDHEFVERGDCGHRCG